MKQTLKKNKQTLSSALKFPPCSNSNFTTLLFL